MTLGVYSTLACATALDCITAGTVYGAPTSDAELGRLIRGKLDADGIGQVPPSNQWICGEEPPPDPERAGRCAA